MSDPWFGEALTKALATAGQSQRIAQLEQEIAASQRFRHGHLDTWLAAIGALPRTESIAATDSAAVTIDSTAEPEAIESVARLLIPWRKGPFDLGGVYIDTEWRCERKWARLARALPDLAGRHVLDVGCGNGYFVLRMAGLGAASVIGIDPTTPYVTQFRLLERLGHGLPATVLPLALEDLAAAPLTFDVVVSAGVLYHRRSPLDHLKDLYAKTAPGGTLLLETLVVPGDVDTALVPEDRYANMRNVWFVPAAAACERWLGRVGFGDIRLVDDSVTTPDEQRRTDWMPFQSLTDALDPADNRLTIEGYAAPRRALFAARR